MVQVVFHRSTVWCQPQEMTNALILQCSMRMRLSRKIPWAPKTGSRRKLLRKISSIFLLPTTCIQNLKYLNSILNRFDIFRFISKKIIWKLLIFLVSQLIPESHFELFFLLIEIQLKVVQIRFRVQNSTNYFFVVFTTHKIQVSHENLLRILK